MAHITRVARAEDGPAMLELLEGQASEGNLGIIYTRRPDAYNSYITENSGVELRICEDSIGQISGQGVLMPHRVYIGSTAMTAGYITGLRKRQNALINIPELNREVASLQGYDLFYCSIIAENSTALQVFQKPRSYLPTLHKFCDYTTYLINPKALKQKFGSGSTSGKKKGDKRAFLLSSVAPEPSSCSLIQANESYRDQLLQFLHSEGSKRDLFPVFAGDEPFDAFAGLKLDDFFILIQNNMILACGALWDQGNYKQYIASGYHGIYRLAIAANPILKLLGYPLLPKVGTAARFVQLSFVLAKDDDPGLYRSFLANIAPKIRQRYSFFSLGVPNGSALDSMLQNCRNFNFASTIYLLDYNKNSGYLNSLNISNNPSPECALL